MTDTTQVQPGSGWQALLYFNIYRVVLAVLLFALLVYGWTPQPVPLASPQHFMTLALLYLVSALPIVLLSYRRLGTLLLQGGMGVMLDVLLLGLLNYYSGGVGSGFEVLMLVSVAGHSILIGGNIVLFFAATASLTVLGVEAYLYLVHLPVLANFSFAGFFSLGLFVIAYGCKHLAARFAHSETLAQHRARELQALAQLNEQIVGMMQVGIIVTDGAGQVELTNTTARRILDAPADHLLPLQRLAPQLAELLHRVTLHPPGVPGIEHLQLGAREYQVTAIQLDAVGRGLLVLEESATVRARALQLKKAALSRLAAGISHELRNPLAAITQAAQLLEESEHIPDRARQLTGVIHRQGQRMNQIVENVLQLSRSRQSRPETLPLQTWLHSFRQEFVGIHHLHDDAIKVSVQPQTLTISVDPTQLHQVLWNLGENALRYSTRNPRIHLRADQDAATGFPYMDVIDRGTGIAQASVQRLFEPFFTTETEGSGLGLYLANELCESNHAMLSLQHNSPHGCCFRIRFTMPLPITAEQTHAHTDH